MAIREELTLGLSGWKQNLDKARDDVKRFHEETRRGSRAASSSVGDVSGASGLGGILALGKNFAPALGALSAVKVGVDALSISMERQRAEMALGAVSAEDTATQLARLAEMAESPGLGFDQVVAGSTRLQAVGFAADEAEKAIYEMGNALALVGGGKEQLDGVLTALTQIVSKGTVSAEEINQIAERLPQIRSLMKDAFGTSDTEMLQSMGIGSEEFIQGIVASASKLERATETASESMSNLQDEWKNFMQSIGDAAEPALQPLLSGLEKALEIAGGITMVLVASGQSISDMLSGDAAVTDAEQAAFDAAIKQEGLKSQELAGVAPAAAETEESKAARFARDKARKESLAEQERLREARADEEESRIIRDRKARETDRKQKAEEAESERERVTESVSRLSFEFASPEEQMRIMRERIQSSLGVSGSREEILAAAATATAEGRLTDAETGLQSLKELEAIAGRVPAGDMATGAAGSFAGLMDQIFGRGTPEQQLDEMRKANTLAEDTSRTLDMILVRMEEAPAVSVFGED